MIVAPALSNEVPTETPPVLSRRAFLGVNLALVLAGAANASAEVTDQDPEISELHFPIPQLPPEFHGYRIGYVTDPHVGIFISPGWVESALATLISAQIDVLLLGGDYVSYEDTMRNRNTALARYPRAAEYSEEELPYRLLGDFCAVLAVFKPPDGIFAVLGNHDRFVDPRFAAAAFAKSGARLLANSSGSIKRGSSELVVDGVEDLWYGSPVLPRNSAPQKHRFHILLAHNPDYFSVALAQNDYRFSLGIAGHTHGGQIRLPLVGPFKRNVFDHRFFEGHSYLKDTHLYTSRGIGVTRLPWRIHCPPELCVFTLARA